MVKDPPVNVGDKGWVRSLDREDPGRRAWQPTPVFLPGEFSRTEEPGGLWPIEL